VDSIIGTNVARPELQRSSNRAVAPRDPSLSTHCVGQPVSGSPVKTRQSILTITPTRFQEQTNFRASPTVAVADEHPLRSDRFLSNDNARSEDAEVVNQVRAAKKRRTTTPDAEIPAS
jgi:hypothetical protein